MPEEEQFIMTLADLPNLPQEKGSKQDEQPQIIDLADLPASVKPSSLTNKKEANGLADLPTKKKKQAIRARLNMQLHNKEEQVEHLKSIIKNFQSVHELEKQELKNEIEKLLQTKEGHKMHIDRLKKSQMNDQVAITALRDKEVFRLRKENGNLRVKVKKQENDIKLLAAEVEKFLSPAVTNENEEVLSLKCEIQKYRSDVELLTEQVNQMKSQLKQKEKNFMVRLSKEVRNKEHEIYQNIITPKDMAISNLQGELHRFRNSKNAQLHRQISKLSSDLGNKEIQIKALQKRGTSGLAEAEIKRLQAENFNLVQQLQNAYCTSHQNNQEVKKLRAELLRSKSHPFVPPQPDAEKVSLRNQIDQLNHQLEKLRLEQNTNDNHNMTVLNKDLCEKDDQIKKLRAELFSIKSVPRTSHDQLVRSNQSKEQEIKNLLKNIERLDKFRIESKQKDSENEALRVEIQRLKQCTSTTPFVPPLRIDDNIPPSSRRH